MHKHIDKRKKSYENTSNNKHYKHTNKHIQINTKANTKKTRWKTTKKKYINKNKKKDITQKHKILPVHQKPHKQKTNNK